MNESIEGLDKSVLKSTHLLVQKDGSKVLILFLYLIQEKLLVWVQ